MADIDNDDDLDLLVGDDIGNVRLYIRDEDGELSLEGNLQADDDDLNVGERAAPEWIDWDLDGDFDLLVGSADGTIRLYINTGSAEEYEYSDEGAIEADGEEIWLGSETAPAFGDLDGDDKRDLIIGSIYGELWFYPNTGDDDAPEFGEGVQLEEEDDFIILEQYSRPELVDWNDDGNLDIVCGGVNPEVRLFISLMDAVPVITVEPDEIDFGSVLIGGRRSQTLTIGNEGEVDLTVSDITIEGQYYRVSFGEEFTVEPDAEHEVYVVFAPESEGEFNGTLTIVSNDPENDELTVSLHGAGATEHIDDDAINTIPNHYYLSEAYPNPFNAVTNLSFGLPVASEISIRVYDISGQKIVTLAKGKYTAGRYRITWNSKDAPAGSYLLRMETERSVTVEKLILIK
ncbi:MAG: FG-GAP-like repeat-containing protein [Candidatus Hatepunaea meridiana]|nr:FG-GAP-like repeat-containing protein [Candidatus Hatepunaea meridiana]